MLKKFSGHLSKLICIALLLTFPVLAQSDEPVIYRNSVNIINPVERIEALKKFAQDYPNSNYINGVYYYLCSSYIELMQVDSSLIYASKYVHGYPEEMRIGVYNDVASLLAEKKVGLDTADIYSSKALALAREQKVKVLNVILDTRALVLYEMNKADSALALEKEAVASNEDEPTLLGSLALYEAAAGNKTAAIETAAKAILFGNTTDALTNFSKWIKEKKPDEKERLKYKNEITSGIVKEFLTKSKKENQVKDKSAAAAFLANTGSNLSAAESLAKETIKSLNKKSSIEDRISFTKNYAIVKSAEGDYKEALKYLISIKDISDPWDVDYWYALGTAYEKIGENENAEDAFITGLISGRNNKLIASIENLDEKIQTENDLIKKIGTKIEQLSSFEPGNFERKSNVQGKVVLAELFTGAECPPCAGADYAFDALSEYYPRNDLAILEYHVHIPGPDPMTNPQTFQRYKYYGGDFGTPTAFINGVEKITGGGPKFLAANRFNVYKYTINKFIDEKPLVSLSGSVKTGGNKLDINVRLKSTRKMDNKISLHIALAEKSINYSGGSGVTKHIFVVRNLIGGAEGLPVQLKNGTQEFKGTIDVGDIEKGLTEYLNDPTNDPSWRRNTKFSGWRERTDKINRNNLIVVAWVQNNDTKEVMQAECLNVPGEKLNQ